LRRALMRCPSSMGDSSVSRREECGLPGDGDGPPYLFPLYHRTEELVNYHLNTSPGMNVCYTHSLMRVKQGFRSEVVLDKG